MTEPRHDHPHRRQHLWILIILVAAVAVAGAGGIYVATQGSSAGGEPPPQSPYDETEAYHAIEQAVADTIPVLPEFPGFEGRVYLPQPCTHNGVDDPNYTNIEVNYSFSAELSSEPLIREQYVDILREHWTNLGYEITWDESSTVGDRIGHELVAERPDGVSYWYSVARIAVLSVQSGCSPVTGVVPNIPEQTGAPGSANPSD